VASREPQARRTDDRTSAANGAAAGRRRSPRATSPGGPAEQATPAQPPRSGRPFAVALATLLALSHGGHGEPPPADTRADWRVGITALRPVRLSAQNAYLASAIPRLLLERLAPIRRHRLGADERLGRARLVLTDAARVASEQVAELQQRRDRQALERAAIDDLERQLTAADGRLRALRELPPEELDIAAHKPLVITAVGSDDPLLPAPRFSPLQAAREADLDLLITGELEEVDGVLFMRILALDSNLGRRVLSYRDVVRGERLDETLAEVERQLAQLMIGEPWGTLTVAPTPAQSAVYVDGVFAGLGVTEVPYQTLGPHTVRVTAPGHEPRESAVTLADGGYTLAPVLAPLAPRPVTIVSTPPGAALFLDSRYLGVTPLQVTTSTRPVRILVRLDGYRDAALVLRSTSGSPLRVDLVRDEYDLAEFQQQQRDQFYVHFGTAVLSLAGPLILFSAAGEAGQRVAVGGSVGADHGLLIGGAVASLVVSGALLVQAVAALGDYLAAAGDGAR